MIDLKKIIGSIYTGVSDDFQRGLFPIFRCVKAENNDLGVVEMEVRRLGNLYGEDKGTGYAGNVWDNNCIAPTLTTMQGGNREPMIIETQIVAMRGINPTNPSDRTVGSPTEQRLEPNSQGICNTLTSVQKDNLVMESSIFQIPRGYNNGGEHKICPPITSHSFQENNFVNNRYRIRKLTPMECWRLMDFTDEDFEKAASVNSQTQLYKQAGNSIVVNVLVAILGQMLPGKEDVYKKRCS